jgi:PD-(D/E)XK nuclease superfamily
LPIHEAQVITYLKLTDCPVGLLINFNVTRLIDGVRRLIPSQPERRERRIKKAPRYPRSPVWLIPFPRVVNPPLPPCE